MPHIFVETNWVVAFVAPSHLQMPAAVELSEQARQGDIRLYLPAICLTEARHPVRTKYQPRPAADAIRRYLGWATRRGRIENERAEVVRVVLDQYEAAVLSELDDLDERLRGLTAHPGIDVFALNEAMLARAAELTMLDLKLEPFDQAILAAVLVRAEELRDQGVDEIAFCELDHHLQPWDKNGESKEPLTSLFDSAHVWVYGDFGRRTPERPPNFPWE